MTADNFIDKYYKDDIEKADPLTVAQMGFNFGIAEEESSKNANSYHLLHNQNRTFDYDKTISYKFRNTA